MVKNFLRNWSPRVEIPTECRQVGALPYAVVDGRLSVLLITSRRSGRWIFPKGAIEPDMSASESAALEALEEAGVVGPIEDVPIGSYRTGSDSDGSALVDVDIYPLLVETQLEDWKERSQRLRHWAVVSEAQRLLVDPALGRIAVALARRFG
ncbi:NUDIX hydrolase [Devosia beringensis]|uniref:NUDIX hydrolase n=1 Tax=Devosia beringensis TaxID=2657486 RepID=UPI00186B875F|nr:NUDIX hydrolase [Devosia beringensis]